jgi:hypothetical protein
MAQGEGRTLHEAFEDYGSHKAAELFDEHGVSDMRFADVMELFEAFHPVQIEVKLYPHNQWVKGYRVRDGG